MSTVLTVVRKRTSAVRVQIIAVAILAFLLATASKAAADQSSIAELNRRVAVTLRSVASAAGRQTTARPRSFDLNALKAPDAAGPLGSRFTLPAWAEPFARASRLLKLRAGGFEFDGWNALVPRGVVRMKYTIRF